MSNSDRRPNILLFLPDQHRPDFIGLNTALPLRTPNLDRLARKGAVFTNAICPSPLCAPSRASLAAGKDYPRCGVVNNDQDYPLDQPTFYQMLRTAGYHVVGVGKFDLHKKSKRHSLDGKAYLQAWGFSDGIDNRGKWDAVNSWDGAPHDPYMAFLHSRGLAELHVQDMQRRHDRSFTDPTPLPEDAYCDNWIAENGLRLLKGFPKDRPWFLQVNFAGPHDPTDVTDAMARRWQGTVFPPPHANDQFDTATHTRIRRNYAAMIENIDRHLGRYLDAIEARGELDDTLIVYSSDHGEMLGDHNLWGKSIYYQPSVGIPLVIAGPGVQPHRSFDGPVVLHDLAATFLDYADLPIPVDMDSRSLRPLLAGMTTQHRPYVISGLVTPRLGWYLIFDGRFKWVRETAGPGLLFDLENDPWEDHNLAADLPGLAVEMDALLQTELNQPS